MLPVVRTGEPEGVFLLSRVRSSHPPCELVILGVGKDAPMKTQLLEEQIDF